MATLSEDLVDDILYFARAGETADLASTLSSITADPTTAFASAAQVLELALDEHSGNNALHMAAGNGHFDTVKEILSHLPTPANQHAPPHAVVAHKNAAGNTPLHWAALNGHVKIVEALVVVANADPTVVNSAGHDPVYEAELNEKMEVVEWILGNCEGLQEGIGGEAGEGEEEEGEKKGEASGSAGAGEGAGASVNGAQGIQEGVERLDLYKGDSREA
ncbi:uncharacterized protein H6S33_003898 [Morchella sextelata]|uniref:uncharacterized protein n=1 Tax=Morchella sextelata TaxID=1174677 RepID=UPI001D0527FB|nr:uncharacterized protein H6S33_003898 [Morchella sextelata]KAH0606237.1 hypothetical protein H6S33_003898 [Morchella sextelata]